MSTGDRGTYGWKQGLPLSLLERIKADLKTATLNRDATARNTLRQIMSEFPNLTVPLTLESGKKSFRLKTAEEITNDDIIGIIRSLIKSERTVLEFKKESTSRYLELLEGYLPRMAGREEIKAWVAANVDFSKLKNPAQAMGPVMKHFGKLADPDTVKAVLQELSA